MQMLLVYPNPWSAFDKDGVPCGVCPRDPEADAGGPGLFVGARVDKTRTKVLQDFAAQHGGGARGAKLAAHELRSPMQRTLYSYMGVASDADDLAELLAAKDPIEVPATKYYRDRLVEGSLVAADEATAKAARVPFTPPKDFFALKSTLLPETPGMVALPQSPDADGNVLEAPPAEAEPVDVASATVETGSPAVELATTIGAEPSLLAEPADAAAPEFSTTKPRNRKPSQESSS